MILTALAGLAAGCIHVFAGPDHLAAVAPLAVDRRRSRWRAGLLWGVGHSGGVWIVGGLALLLRGVLPVEALSAYSERLVGAVLIGIGLWGLRQAFRRRVHTHAHTHDGDAHEHVHLHDPAADHEDDSAHMHVHVALGVGILHGLAGSSHLLGVLPALALPTAAASLVYILAFGLGTIAAMTGFAALLGLVTARAGRRRSDFGRHLLTVSSAVAIAVGLFWLVGPTGG